ncbi:uroporphyrinogen decarboxylase family protein [Chloroflexota bacterium]
MQFKPDKLTPSERMEAILTRQKPDRVPFIPFMHGFCPRNVGYPVAAMYEDAEKSFWSQVWTQRQYDYDGSPLYGYASYGGWEFGGGIEFPRSEWEQAPVVTRFPVQTEEDVWNLKSPDVKMAGSHPIIMEFSKLQAKMGMPVTGTSEGAFTTAGNICGVDQLCKWMIKKPEVAHRLLRVVTDFLVQTEHYWVKTFGAEKILAFIAEPTASNQLISPKQFEEFVLPYNKELQETILDMGIKHIFCHICGEQNLNLPHWAKIPMGDPGIVSFGHEVDLEVAGKYFPHDIIAGNVEPAVLQSGTADQVYELCQIAIGKGRKCPGGFVLMAGCEFPVMAPPYNLWIMRKAIDDFGWY